MSTETLVTRDDLAEVIHDAKLGVLRWSSLPDSPRNPQRYDALRRADAILARFDVSLKAPESRKDPR